MADEKEKLKVQVASLHLPALPEESYSSDALAIAKQVDGSNYYGKTGTIAKNAKWRLDRQKPPPGLTNIQIQRNGVPRPSTVACVLVPDILSDQIQGAPANRRPMLIKELERVIKEGLHRGEKSRKETPSGGWTITAFRVVGDFSS